MLKIVNIVAWRGATHEDCMILRMESGAIEIAFPFHEDMSNIFLHMTDALTLRNALDELTAVKLLREPKSDENWNEEMAPTNIHYIDKVNIDRVYNEYSLKTLYDIGARHAIERIKRILKLEDTSQ